MDLVRILLLAATIYIDSSMAGDCTTGNYSIANRTCTGSDGNAYNDILAALNASAANDTIYFRAGSYTSNVTGAAGIGVKNGQTWGTYPPDGARSATVIGDPTNQRVFGAQGFYGVNDAVIRDLTIVGPSSGTAARTGIFFQNTQRSKAINNDISGFHRDNTNEGGGVQYFGQDDTSPNAIDGQVTDNYIHDPGPGTAIQTAGVHLASIGTTYTSNILVARNRIVGTTFGVWGDVQACQPAKGATPCTAQDNYIKNVTDFCLHQEIGSTFIWERNICDSPGRGGLLMRPGSDVNTQTKVYNNTFYNAGRTDPTYGQTIWIQADVAAASGGLAVTNLEIKNNIIYRSGGTDGEGLMVSELTVPETTNRYQNNLFDMVSSTKGVCWGSAAGQTGPACAGTPGTTYDDTSSGLSSWQAAAPSGVASGNLAGDPLFANPAGEDFRLCTAAGAPIVGCTGRSPAIDAGVNVGLPYNGSAPDIGAVESLAAPRAFKVTQY